MYKLKVKSSFAKCCTTYYYNTFEEVANKIAEICNSNNICDILKTQKEFNYRFYISEVKSK